jgi:ribosome-binding protein aMBF1 (putative translation factor)
MTELKKKSTVLQNIRDRRDPLVTARTRNSVLLAALISKAMKQLGWSRVELAEKMNKKPSVITRWLSGTHNFTADTLSDIQVILGVQLLMPVKDSDIIVPANNQETLTLQVNIFEPFTNALSIPVEGGVALDIKKAIASSGTQVLIACPQGAN